MEPFLSPRYERASSPIEGLYLFGEFCHFVHSVFLFWSPYAFGISKRNPNKHGAEHLCATIIATAVILTTAAVTKRNQELLKRIGRKGETYDQIINRLYMLAKRQLFYEGQHRILREEEFAPLDEV